MAGKGEGKAPKKGPFRRGRVPVNPTPRVETSLTERQEKFAQLYAATNDMRQSLIDAGYSVPDEPSYRSLKSRLLRIPSVAALIDEVRAEPIKKYSLTAEATALRLQMVYLHACQDRDWGAAIAALREIGKMGGYYEKHNTQKKYTQADVEKLRAELEAAGFDFTRIALQPPSPN